MMSYPYATHFAKTKNEACTIMSRFTTGDDEDETTVREEVEKLFSKVSSMADKLLPVSVKEILPEEEHSKALKKFRPAERCAKACSRAVPWFIAAADRKGTLEADAHTDFFELFTSQDGLDDEVFLEIVTLCRNLHTSL